MFGWGQESTGDGHLTDHEPIGESELWGSKYILQIAGESLRHEVRL